MSPRISSTGPAELFTSLQSYLPGERVALVEKAYSFAEECHRGQKRLSGGPYIEHPLQTASFLADLHLDVTTIAAALLHDVIEDCGVTCEELKQRFGDDVARLVDGVTKLTRMDLKLMGRDDPEESGSLQDDHLRAESLRKMLVAMAEDVRVVLIKLADRLHNMRTLGALAPARRRAIAQETLDIYTPLAHRLGIWDIKWRLRGYGLSPPGRDQIQVYLQDAGGEATGKRGLHPQGRRGLGGGVGGLGGGRSGLR